MKGTAIITGGIRGIGQAISLRLARDGYNIVLNYLRDDRQAEKTRDLCLQYTENVLLQKADVASAEEVQAMVHTAVRKFGTLAVLVNNAGVNIDKALLKMTEEDWDRVVDTNMKGIFVVTREVARYMLEQRSRGSIINIGATTGISGRKNGLNYCASKAGVLVMTKCLAMELGPSIRVNCIIPGFTRTDETEERFQLQTRMEEELGRRRIPLERIGVPDDVAAAVSFLVSDQAEYINGQKLIIDGGEYMY
ncbi:glucose 1-dehydrogenase [Chitinophaga oryzae]|uniref:Glucose 1-dehydrogenase n=1 Tax=Chitinophaga oryzae TaxID=2725414 RepID=A0AAE7D952_9BACT|nr:glucose 1-dehydrogenase [Chitinophaga oryzae]QJB32838.1 glucose 1-dehydrogenase [Chitinophaga oryzae]QJB39291.1 glucose 1-dehydrogenase [Chitinophaga oryzae]